MDNTPSEIPFEFPGQIYYIASLDDRVGSRRLNYLNSKADESPVSVPIGVGVEYPNISPESGPGQFCFIQMCNTFTSCYVVKVNKENKLGEALNRLLTHPNVKVVGVNIKKTISDLAKKFPDFKYEAISKNCIDVGTLANEVLPFQKFWTLETLVSYKFKMKCSKERRDQMSEFYDTERSMEYIRCVATDGYASFALYFEFAERLNELQY